MARGRRLGTRAIVIGRPSGDPTRWVGYILDQDRAQYANYSGTGNALNANQPVVRRMIIDRLRYWVAEMHVDGSLRPWRRAKLVGRSKIRRSSGTSSRIPCSPAPN